MSYKLRKNTYYIILHEEINNEKSTISLGMIMTHFHEAAFRINITVIFGQYKDITKTSMMQTMRCHKQNPLDGVDTRNQDIQRLAGGKI